MKKLFLLFITVVIILPCMAQEAKPTKSTRKEERKLRISAIAKQEEEGVIKYRKHTVFGIKLTTDGYGGFLEIARARSVKKALLFQLDIAERKHPKEEKQQNPSDFYGATSPLIYGKINFFYPVKLGVQQQFLLGNKGNKNGVSITANVGGGFVAGLLRPYLLEVQDDTLGATKYVGFDPNDSTGGVFLNGPVLGGPNLSKGWDKMKLTPGVYLKSAFRFDFGKYNEMVNAIEVGVMGEYYSKSIPQMARNKAYHFFFSAYVSIIFGKRK
ncbi:MAG: hypothetical protein QM737_20765 [Ferruginibacter sp.]